MAVSCLPVSMRIGSTLFSFSRVAILQWWICLLLAGSFPSSTNGITITSFREYERDRQALLAIKSQIHDPLGVTSSWNNSVSLCRWRGVTCGRKNQRVTQLDLKNQNLRGSLSPYIGNLSFLRFIDLRHNLLSGGIPPEIGRLSRLKILMLRNNSFGGTLPANLSRCSKLVHLVAGQNSLVGNIPAEFGNLLKLEKLGIDTNFLTGQLPVSLGNLSSLRLLNVGVNRLQGRLPDTLGQLKRLVNLTLDQNNFFGLLPPPIYNISSIEMFSLPSNQFHGSLPDDLGFTLVNVKKIYIGINNFSGTLPESLSNASKLEELDVSDNFFTGKVSIDFSRINMTWVNMENNNLGSGLVGDLDFVTSLTNCSNLDTLSLADNQFGGMLPNSLTNLSTMITVIHLGTNRVTGTIPSGIANLVNLISIGLEENRLTGPIPHAIGKLKNLQGLTLGENKLAGRIPTSFGNLTRLNVLALYYNELEGGIPPGLGNCQNLVRMVLSGNRLTGVVPRSIFSITTLSTSLELSNNLLRGSLPSEVGNLKNILNLDLSGNQLSGQVPSALGGCTSLENLNLGNNNFYGSIPDSLSSLRSIALLDLSHNNFSGQIPEYLENLSYLKYLNLSYNHFEGKVPSKGVFSNATSTSLIGNDKLCGGIAELHLPLCHFNEQKKSRTSHSLKIILIVCGVLGFLSLSFSLLFYWLRNNREVLSEPSSVFPLRTSIPRISYQQLLKATNGFSPANLIGQGSFGSVYRGMFNQNQEQQVIAVKVMNLQETRASKSFIAECKTLGHLKHRNLVKIISACSSVDFQGNAFKALVYEFMPNGSLEGWLHPPTEADSLAHREPKILNFLQRLNIAIDVACALDYLHHHCQVPVFHCDLKPSNILLDHDMVAHLGDFGLARFFPKSTNKFSGYSTSTLDLKGTVGYAAPEYGIGTEATTSGDMYSFGILLLEMYTSKRPTDDMFKDGLTLHHFAKLASPDQLHEVVDPLLLAGDNEEENASSSRNPSRAHMRETKMKECLISILRVGIACSVESPKDRMDIVDAAKELHFIRDKFLGARIRTQS
ncbi:Leucine-rich repeat protein kinase family protein, putative [Theobroma cacao]|uniref:non-specific serine/threonine protein kinase n=1 Tax=Theobroma cacao TaxID=3641 RepID=A0A061GW97_THECC|nr:Leucine-rich repeat protein kinase family protein, putative [Theobroma cacao]